MTKLFKARPSQLGKIMGDGKVPGSLSAGCITYLKQWIANDFEEDIESKYTRKGNIQEGRCIDFASKMLGLGLCFKNKKRFSNEYIEGEPDMLPRGLVVDTKCSWSMKTLMDSAEQANKDYELQVRGYMWLADRPAAIVFHGLLDTPEEANYGRFVSWEHLPEEQRWVAYKYLRDKSIEDQIVAKVLKCRYWIEKYTSNIGKLIE